MAVSLQRKLSLCGILASAGVAAWKALSPLLTAAPALLALSNIISACLFLAALCMFVWAAPDIGKRLLRPKSSLNIPLFVWTWHFRRTSTGASIDFEDWLPVRVLVPMTNAVARAYPVMKKVTVFRLMHVLDGKDPKTLPGIVAGMLCGHSLGTIPLYGVCPPGETLERIPEEEAQELMFSDNGGSLIDSYQKGFDGRSVEKWVNVAIKKRDLAHRLREFVG